MQRRQQGFTLIEMMIVIGIVAVILSIGVPAFGSVIDRQRVTSVADDLANSLRRGRSEAVLAGVSEQVSLQFAVNAGGWSYALTSTAHPSEPLVARTSEQYGNDVALVVNDFDGSGNVPFSATRQLSSDGAGSIDIVLNQETVITVSRNLLGGVSVCSPSGDFGYAVC